MRNFRSFGAMADFLETVVNRVPTVVTQELDRVGEEVKRAAQAKPGAYQSAAGPFDAWQQLADATLAYHELVGAHMGADPDSPELVFGPLRASIEDRVIGHESHVGSDDPVMEYQEFGTNRISARSILGAAMFEQAPKQRHKFMMRLQKLLETGR